MLALAENLKRLRKAAGLTQASLAERAGLARASLAHMEQPQSNPGIEAVLAVANALGIGLDELLRAAVQQRCFKVAPRDIPEQRSLDGLFVARLVSPIAAKGVQIQTVTMYPGCRNPGRPHPHGSQEFFYTWSGRVEILIDGDNHSIEAGALLQFPGHIPHIYCNPDRDRQAQAFSVVVLQMD